MKTLFAVLLSLFLASFTNLVWADWFLSSQIKAKIASANAGDVEAQLIVGAAYDSGDGAPRDINEAIKWYQMAAERDNAGAQNSLGSIFQEQKRYAEALSWYEKAAAQGHARATNNLAYLYDAGLGVPQDRQKGFELYSQAADLGWAEAMWNIANMYGAGQLGKVDEMNACIWSLRARTYAKSNERQLASHLNRVVPHFQNSLSAEQWTFCNQQAVNWEPK